MKMIDCSKMASLMQSLATAHEVTTITSVQKPSQRKSGIVSLFLLFTSALLLVGCDAQQVRDSLSGPDDEPVTVRYVSGMLSSSPNESAPEDTAIERFSENVPGITIDRQQQQHGLSHFLSESPPADVIMWYDSYELRHVARQNLLSDLTHIWADNDLVEAYGRQFREVGPILLSHLAIQKQGSWFH